MQLSPGPLAVFTVVGVVVGTVVWWLVCRSAAAPKQLLRRLVPIVLIGSFVPYVALGLTGTPWSTVVGLMTAHLAVFAVTVPVLVRRLPPR